MPDAEQDVTTGDEFARIAETVTRDRMAYYGYTPERIKAAEEWPGHEASGCFFENWNWVCTDEDQKPNHPDRDELERTAEFVVWMLEHPALPRPFRSLLTKERQMSEHQPVNAESDVRLTDAEREALDVMGMFPTSAGFARPAEWELETEARLVRVIEGIIAARLRGAVFSPAADQGASDA